jgi:hypothetical protein
VTIDRSRKGKFDIPYIWIDNGYHDLMLSILAGCLILKAEFSAERDVIEYWAFHKDFPSIKDGVSYPNYTPCFTIRDKDPYREVGMSQAREVERVFIGWKDSIAQGVNS